MVAINLDASVVVRFIDYGNTEEIHATSLKKLKAHLEALPIKVNFQFNKTNGKHDTTFKTITYVQRFLCAEFQ